MALRVEYRIVFAVDGVVAEGDDTGGFLSAML